ncbi:class I adenylate-forming enzyme family protein [Microbacterium sp. No. 7]|uniref:class I adenylate-forming enzyme family protein n=1 Tax=Microbacterium sp. No. 7 TaxID=1714373 RepID=UPI0006D2BB22|nr:AMP-binding protein [Microbacterium sp. No. 7]ALJ21912.1 hypothetical protein AOA12_19220 [Microbacterium sp. No. 7]
MGDFTPPATTSRLQTTVTSAFAAAYARFAAHVAIESETGETLTYAELGDRARRIAGGLAALGVQKGDRVVIVTKNRPEAIVLDHASAAGGFGRVALSFRLHPREIADAALDCTAAVAFVEGDYEEAVAEAFAAAGVATRIIAIDESRTAAIGYADLLRSEPIVSPEVDPEDIAQLSYTSGTTGRPKGVILSHRSLMACARNLMVELDRLETSDVVLHVAPLTHLSGYLSVPLMMRGTRQIPVAAFDPVETLRLIEERGVTILPAVPTMLNLLLPALDAGDHDTSSLHTVVYGGSAIAPARLQKLGQHLGDVFLQVYGLTEVPFPLVSLSKEEHRFDPDQPPPARLAAAGRVTPFVQIRLVDDDGDDVAEGESGEIWVRADTMMSGYWGNPEGTSELLRPGGWAATGDVARIEDGYLYIVDRKKDMIVSGGFNIYPAEIESVLYGIEGVREVAVVGSPSVQWGETVKAFLSLHPGAEVTVAQVEDVCARLIAPYKRPRLVEIIDEIPKASTGKIQRRVLRDREWANAPRKIGE